MPATRRMLLPLIIIVLVSGSAALGATLTVPSTHRTLGDALAEARPGDIIEIQPGIYREHDLAVPTAVTIRGLGGQPADVVIDGSGRGRILACENVSGRIILQNLTFRGGAPVGNSTRQQSGGAVFVSRSELVVQNCRFEGNAAAAHGGAIRFVAAGGRIVQCEFVGNRATFGGGAIDCSYDSSPLIERCTFTDNEGGWGGAVSCRVESSPRIDRSSFTGNSTTNRFGYGGGIFADLESAPRIARSTLTGNVAAFGGALGCFQGSRVVIEGCTMAGNTARGAGAGIYCIDGSPRLTTSIIAFQDGSGVESIGLALPELGCSNIYGNLGGDVNGPATGVAGAEPTISADPGFCTVDPDAPGALLIASDSPSAGSSCGPMGAWPTGCSLPTPVVASFVPTVEGTATAVRWTTNNDHPGANYRLTWMRTAGTEREILVEQTGDNAFAGLSAEPPAFDSEVVFRLYRAENDGIWLLAAESGYSDGGDGELPTPPNAVSVRNWPNPFNPETTIGVTVTRDQRVRVAIYNLEGRLVRELADRMFTAGEDQLSWDGRDDRGQAMSSGGYIVRVSGESDSRAHKITLLK